MGIFGLTSLAEKHLLDLVALLQSVPGQERTILLVQVCPSQAEQGPLLSEAMVEVVRRSRSWHINAFMEKESVGYFTGLSGNTTKS